MSNKVEYVSFDPNIKSSNKSFKNNFLKNSLVFLIFINVFLFFVQLYFKSFTSFMIFDPNNWYFRPWTLISYAFLHADFSHLFFNMYALYLFGSLLELKIGTKNFLKLYFFSIILNAILSSFFYTNSYLGASGVVMTIIGTLIVLWPNLKLYFFFLFPINLWQAGIIWFLIDFVGIFIPSNIGHLGHIFGLFIGLFYGFFLVKSKKKFLKKFIKF